MRIYLIRHGDPHYPDDSLTTTGHREAEALAEHLAQTGLDEIYSSPRGRARLTAGYTARQLRKPLTIEPWANELDGLYSEKDGHALWDVDGQRLRSPEVLGSLNHWNQVPPLNHPALAGHLARIRAGSDQFLMRQGFSREGSVYRVIPGTASNTRRIALFAHLGFGLAWLSHLLDIPLPLMWAGFYLHPSSVTTILFEERTPGIAVPRILALGDLSHLTRAGLHPTPAGIIANYE